MNLRIKFILGIGIFSGIAFTILIIFFIYHEKKYLTEELKLRGETICMNLAENAEDPLFEGDDLLLNKFVHDVKKRNPDVIYACITDIQSKIVAHSNLDLVGKKYESPKNENLYEFSFPIKMVNKKIGNVYLGISKESIKRAVNETIKGASLIAFSIVLMSFLFIYLVISLMTGEIEKITKNIVAIGDGNLDVNIKTKRKDEIGKIAGAVNTMVVKLKNAQRELIKKERMEREMEIAREIQESLLPEKLPSIPGYEMKYYYKPAFEVGGDYFDLIPLPNGKFALVTADVSGKGVPAALIMAMAKTTIQIASRAYTFPRDVLALLHQTIRRNTPEDAFLTIVYAIFDPKNSEIIFARAGHNSPAFYSFKNKEVKFISPFGTAIGFPIEFKEFKSMLEERRIKLEKGDLFILYTDGIIEARDIEGNEYGEERFKKFILENAQENVENFVKRFVEEIEDFILHAPSHDDLTIFVLKKV